MALLKVRFLKVNLLPFFEVNSLKLKTLRFASSCSSQFFFSTNNEINAITCSYSYSSVLDVVGKLGGCIASNFLFSSSGILRIVCGKPCKEAVQIYLVA